MNWSNLTSLSQLDALTEESNKSPILIFKHSRSCSISSTVLNRLERNWEAQVPINAYFLDLLTYRQISQAIAERFQVRHESPQILIIEQGEAVYDRSHFDINYKDIKAQLLAHG